MLNREELRKQTENAINWIRNYVERSGAKGVVVGNSGGKDSATVIAMAVRALGENRVVPISMPCESVMSDMEDAKEVAKTFGVNLVTIDLTESFKLFKDDVSKEFGGNGLSDEALINIKPRLRMTTLYAVAQSLGFLVIGTGNLSEAMVRIYYKMGR